MRNPFLFIALLVISLNSFGQKSEQRFIKFFHVGEQIQPVYTLNISYSNAGVPKDPDERVLDTLPAKSIVTDEKSYDAVLSYIKHTNFKLGPSENAGKLYFGTFKVIYEGRYFYLPGNSVTKYFKDMVAYLKKKKTDPNLTQEIVDNYPWIFNP
jgi:hypothetical protein